MQPIRNYATARNFHRQKSRMHRASAIKVLCLSSSSQPRQVAAPIRPLALTRLKQHGHKLSQFTLALTFVFTRRPESP